MNKKEFDEKSDYKNNPLFWSLFTDIKDKIFSLSKKDGIDNQKKWDLKPLFNMFKRKKISLTESEKNEAEENLQRKIYFEANKIYLKIQKWLYSDILDIACSARTRKWDDKDFDLKVFEWVVKNVTDNIWTLMQELKDSPEVVKLIVAKLANRMYSIDNKILFIDTYIRGMVEANKKK